MTATVLAFRSPQAAESDLERQCREITHRAVREGLAWLARHWEDNPDVLALKALVHPSLRQGYALDRLWGDYRHILGVLERYEDGMADWHDFGPDWESAGGNIRGEAEYAVLDLIHGIGRGGDAA